MVTTFVAIGIGASLGAFFRWGLGIVLNPVFPTIPLGTLAANIIGGFLMGLFMGLSRGHAFFPEWVRLGVATGFLGGLTTFSTFSGEAVNLIGHQEYLFATFLIGGHLVGSLLATGLGLYMGKLFLSSVST